MYCAGVFTANVYDEVTVRVTGITCDGLPGELTVIVPVYVPAGRLPALAATVRTAGAVPPEGVTESQLTWADVLTETENVGDAPVAPMFRFCQAGAGPFTTWVKLRALGETVTPFEVMV